MTLTEIYEQFDRAVYLLAKGDEVVPSDELERMEHAVGRLREMIPVLQNLAIDHVIRHHTP